MLKKSQLQWTAKNLVKNVNDGNVNFDCAIQRPYTWDISRKSLFIKSLIEDYPIPLFSSPKMMTELMMDWMENNEPTPL